jgi:hypothetical protein
LNEKLKGIRMGKTIQKVDTKNLVSKQAATKKYVKPTKKKSVIWNFPMTKENFVIAGIGLAIIVVGFLFMATGITEEPAVLHGKWNNPMAITLAPILLMIGYCIIIPYAIMKFGKKSEPTEE